MGSAVETLLKAIGLAIWLFVGAPTLLGFWRAPANLAGARGAGWLALYLAFGVAFWIATGPFAMSSRRAGLAAQSLAALGLIAVGMPEFEGALLAVVAAQTPALFPVTAASAWTAAQAIPLFVAIYPSHHLQGSAQATGAYLAFGGFAMGANYLRQREVRARLELGRLNAELVGTQRLLADSSRLSERLRISRELHDTLGHHLIALNLRLEREQQRAGESPGPVADAKQIVQQMLADVREVVTALRRDGGLDLGRAIQALAVSVPEPKVHLELPERLDPVDPDRAHALFRCVQEGLTNSVKHGEARNVWIRIERTEERLALELKDDGRGAAQVAWGHGLTGMKERLAQLGGELAVGSRPGQGFELKASLPLRQEAAK